MNRFRRNPFMVIIAVLIVIGILSGIARNPLGSIIPVLVFGGVFLLYKYPPYRWKMMLNKSRSSWEGFGAKDRRKTKQGKFTVIPGSKPKDDEEPKYH